MDRQSGNSPEMRISPKYRVEDWERLRLSLGSGKEDWEEAIRVFEDRYYGRFFEPISKIESYEYSGFTILALDCLLIETLQQFVEGREDSRYESKESFVRFLTGTSFKKWFADKDLAKKFYDEIRCGILHQAETKGSSKVRASGALVSKDGEGIIVNRICFHRRLLSEFEDYKDRLRNASQVELRENFIKKMGYICRLPQFE